METQVPSIMSRESAYQCLSSVIGIFRDLALDHMMLPVPHAELLGQHLDYKMRDQRLAKRWDSGTFAGQMAVPLLLLSCHWATTGRSLEAEAYAILHARSAVQLVAWKQSSEAKRRKWQNTCKHKFGVIRCTYCAAVYLEHLQLRVSRFAWHFECSLRRQRHYFFSLRRSEQTQQYQPLAVCIINLLNSCQVTPIVPYKETVSPLGDT